MGRLQISCTRLGSVWQSHSLSVHVRYDRNMDFALLPWSDRTNGHSANGNNDGEDMLIKMCWYCRPCCYCLCLCPLCLRFVRKRRHDPRPRSVQTQTTACLSFDTPESSWFDIVADRCIQAKDTGTGVLERDLVVLVVPACPVYYYSHACSSFTVESSWGWDCSWDTRR